MSVDYIEQLMKKAADAGKYVLVVLKDGARFRGKACHFVSPYDREDGYATIWVDDFAEPSSVRSKDIKTIKIIE